ncbi:hypothetical protein G8E10_09510 [Rhizobiaceae bacterium CRRU44]|uniref:Uncharacterized protein n=1 Tax=Ferranicluibacter rubi TaxID=2715133 RepID=A0AA43ZFA6_9HYPH|nr:hypothetical protein [Ferranicluibacter rubi]NHT75915.1 hypothetical protein [Ferranicluibacter rubi]NHT75975.1 hypothetical protein [Ferranicluibacter rubi]
MLATWTKVLPYFIVVWFAKRYCERFDIVPGFTSVMPHRGIIMHWKTDTPGRPEQGNQPQPHKGLRGAG